MIRIDSGQVPSNRILHPEALYPAAFFEEALRGRLDRWSTWTTPFAPYFFPDLPLYGLCRLVAGDALAAVLLYGAAQMLLLATGFRAVIRAGVERGSRSAAELWLPLTVSSFVLASALGWTGSGLLLLTYTAAFHTGALVVAVWSLALLVRGLRTPGPDRAAATALGFLVAAGVVSDRLVLPLFVVPALLVVAVELAASRRKGTPTGPAIRAGATVLLAALAGLGAHRWIRSAGGLAIAEFGATDVGRLVERLGEISRAPGLGHALVDSFFSTLGTPARLGWLCWILSVAVLSLSHRRGVEQGPTAGIVLVCRWCLASVLVTAASSLALGVAQYGLKVRYSGILFISRYLLGPYLLPALTLPMIAVVLLGPRRAWRAGLALAAAVSVLTLGLASRTSWKGERLRQPEDVACLDRLAAEHGLKTGLAHFYAARRITVLSRRGLHVDQVSERFFPMTWIDDSRREGAYDFVLVHRIDPDVVETLGPPDARADCGSGVLIYRRPRLFPAPTEADGDEGDRGEEERSAHGRDPDADAGISSVDEDTREEEASGEQDGRAEEAGRRPDADLR